jgi:hypothetical protein
MTVLLLFLLVVYFAVVSAPISIRLVGLVLARTKSSELPLLWRPTTLSAPGRSQSGSGAVRDWSQRDSRVGLGPEGTYVQGGSS